MDRRSELVRIFETAQARQRELGPIAQAFNNANLPLLAESYVVECRQLGVVMWNAIEELQAMDKAAKAA